MPNRFSGLSRTALASSLGIFDFLLPLASTRSFHTTLTTVNEGSSSAGPSKRPMRNPAQGQEDPEKAKVWARQLRQKRDNRRMMVSTDVNRESSQLSRQERSTNETVPVHPGDIWKGSSKRPPRSFIHYNLDRIDKPRPAVLKDALRIYPRSINPVSLTTLVNYAERTGHTNIAAQVRRVRKKVDYRHRENVDPTRRGQVEDDTDTAWRLRRIEPHPWARARFPLERSLLVRDMQELMSDLHLRILSPTPVAMTCTPEQAVQRVKKMIRREERGWKGTTEALVDVLNLYVIYCSMFDLTGMEMTQRILDQCEGLKPNKQTLHLLVQHILWPNTLSHKEGRLREPSTSASVTKEISELFSWTYHMFGLSPGTETYRHMLMYAGLTDDRQLGQIAVDGYKLARDEGSQVAPGEGDVARYKHTSTRSNAWRNLVRVLKHKGFLDDSGNVQMEREKRVVVDDLVIERTVNRDEHSTNTKEEENTVDMDPGPIHPFDKVEEPNDYDEEISARVTVNNKPWL